MHFSLTEKKKGNLKQKKKGSRKSFTQTAKEKKEVESFFPSLFESSSAGRTDQSDDVNNKDQNVNAAEEKMRPVVSEMLPVFHLQTCFFFGLSSFLSKKCSKKLTKKKKLFNNFLSAKEFTHHYLDCPPQQLCGECLRLCRSCSRFG